MRFIKFPCQILFVLLLAVNSVQAAQPALWKLEYQDKTSWVFGTIHASTQVMRNDNSLGLVKNKITNARLLITEVDLAQYSAEQQQELALKVALLTNGKNLQQQVDDKTWQSLLRYQQNKGIPENAFSAFTPWFVALQLGIIEGQIAGLDFTQAIDDILMQHARANQVQVSGLESLEQQLGFFANSGISEELLVDTLAQIETNEYTIKHLADMWQNGEIEQLEKLLTLGLAEYPSTDFVLDTLLKERNQNWMKKLIAEVKTGNVVIAVGLMHMVGEGNIIQHFEQQGVSVKRVQ
ncbi:TraB/GumN family protein [Catenovulum sp. SX2]|uniref:TraB/GumN family protein n=1 Tax=Catenovulum sp. SX2 TaxID=3398614 RepID=UPI003F82AEBB